MYTFRLKASPRGRGSYTSKAARQPISRHLGRSGEAALSGREIRRTRQPQTQGVDILRALPGAKTGTGNLVAVVGHQLLGREVHVSQHVLDGVVGFDAGVVVAAILTLVDVHRIGVAEQVVHVAEDFLIGA